METSPALRSDRVLISRVGQDMRWEPERGLSVYYSESGTIRIGMAGMQQPHMRCDMGSEASSQSSLAQEKDEPTQNHL